MQRSDERFFLLDLDLDLEEQGPPAPKKSMAEVIEEAKAEIRRAFGAGPKKVVNLK